MSITLTTLLQSAINTFNADKIDIDYENGETIVYAFKNNSGMSIANLTNDQWKKLSLELSRIEKTKLFLINGAKYRISIHEYESFGETQYTISISKIGK